MCKWCRLPRQARKHRHEDLLAFGDFSYGLAWDGKLRKKDRHNNCHKVPMQLAMDPTTVDNTSTWLEPSTESEGLGSHMSVKQVECTAGAVDEGGRVSPEAMVLPLATLLDNALAVHHTNQVQKRLKEWVVLSGQQSVVSVPTSRCLSLVSLADNVVSATQEITYAGTSVPDTSNTVMEEVDNSQPGDDLAYSAAVSQDEDGDGFVLL